MSKCLAGCPLSFIFNKNKADGDQSPQVKAEDAGDLHSQLSYEVATWWAVTSPPWITPKNPPQRPPLPFFQGHQPAVVYGLP